MLRFGREGREGGREEEAIKSRIVLENTGMEVLDEMFICSLSADQKVQPRSNPAAAKNRRGTVELGSPKPHQITGPDINAAHGCRHGKGTVCQSGEKSPEKVFSPLGRLLERYKWL